MADAVQTSGSSKITLPPPPPLDEKFVRKESVQIDGGVTVHTYMPASPEYRCKSERAPALVLVPGLGMDALGFMRQLPLGEVCEVHLYQKPNDAYAGEQGLGHFAHAVEGYIKAKGLEKRPGGVVLGGCSMGGAVSLATAIRGKVKLRGLVLIGTFGNCMQLPFFDRWFNSLIFIVPFGLARRAARWVVGNTQYFGKIKADEADWMVSITLERTRGYYTRAVRALTCQNQIPSAKLLKLPTLVLHGTKDRVLPYAAGQELACAIPGAKLVTINESGHALFFTDHEEVNQAIADFIVNLPE